MKLLKWLLILIVSAVGAFLVVGFMLPDTVRLERSIVLQSKPATVYAVLNGFRHFNKWSPWAELDPNTQYTVEGPITGVGAKQSWSSQDPSVGAGSQEIIEVAPNQLVKTKLVFSDFDTDNKASFIIAPEGEGSRLSWVYESNFKGQIVARYFGLLLDDMLGPDYEKGLLKLQALLAKLPQDDLSQVQIEAVQMQPMPIAYISGEASATEAGAKLGELYGKVVAAIQAAGAQQNAAPLAITREFNEETKFWQFDAALPVDKADLVLPPESEVKTGQTYIGLALKITHKGPYAAMEPTYQQLIAYKTLVGYEDNGNSWEHYITDPGNTPEAELLTHVYWPVK